MIMIHVAMAVTVISILFLSTSPIIGLKPSLIYCREWRARILNELRFAGREVYRFIAHSATFSANTRPPNGMNTIFLFLFVISHLFAPPLPLFDSLLPPPWLLPLLPSPL
jgi:hypothetical protein